MLFLKEVVNSKKCEVDIDYYVPFSINIIDKNIYNTKVRWRTGNFKNSLIEVTIDKKDGTLRGITLISVDRAFLVNTVLESIDEVESGTPVFCLDGNIKNDLCDQLMDFYVYLGLNFIMVKFSKEIQFYKFIELDRVRFGFDKDNKLVSIIVKNLSNHEYTELKDGLKL